METPIGEEDDSHLGDFIEDQEATSPSEHAAYELLKEQLEDVLDTLTDREENVLRLRFGLMTVVHVHLKKSVKCLVLRVSVSAKLKQKHYENYDIQAEVNV